MVGSGSIVAEELENDMFEVLSDVSQYCNKML